MAFVEAFPRIFRAGAPLPQGALGALLERFGAQVVIGHPTFRNTDNIGQELQRGIAAAVRNYSDRKVAFVVSDGTYRMDDPDASTLAAAVEGAAGGLGAMGDSAGHQILVCVLAYDGYGGDRTPGKGSALKLIFDELAHCPSLEYLILLDGDLRNDFGPWFRVFRAVAEEHGQIAADRDFFITARYARHFVDASLTRFIVGPLTTLMGCYVPGGISGDIVLSAGAAGHERTAVWDAHRRRYGTDIATTFDNIADPQTDIYEVYLGAKLHDITDEAKLSVMPGEVIGAALERLLHYQQSGGRVKRLLSQDGDCLRPQTRGPEHTGIEFIDPGYTDVFDADQKRTALLTTFPDHAEAMRRVLLPETFALIEKAHVRLSTGAAGAADPLQFLGVTRELWIEILYQSLAHLLCEQDPQTTRRCLNYLYTAVFVEFCREKIASLGARTYGEVREMQKHLGVPARRAQQFYRQEVDAVVETMALDFFRGRRRILDLLADKPHRINSDRAFFPLPEHQ